MQLMMTTTFFMCACVEGIKCSVFLFCHCYLTGEGYRTRPLLLFYFFVGLLSCCRLVFPTAFQLKYSDKHYSTIFIFCTYCTWTTRPIEWNAVRTWRIAKDRCASRNEWYPVLPTLMLLKVSEVIFENMIRMAVTVFIMVILVLERFLKKKEFQWF